MRKAWYEYSFEFVLHASKAARFFLGQLVKTQFP